MLHIQKGEQVELIVTADEKKTIVGGYYLFWFKHQTLNIEKAFILTDDSDFPHRYNSFTFTEGSTAQKTLDVGMHYYKIYAQTSSSNLDPDLATEELERGIADVKDDSTTVAEFDTQTTYKQYAG